MPSWGLAAFRHFIFTFELFLNKNSFLALLIKGKEEFSLKLL